MDLKNPRVMGIINLTPDSFYRASRTLDIGNVVDRVGAMIEDGADMIDLGAASTRPGSISPSVTEEIDRITGPLMAIRAAFPDLFISIDTFRSEVLKSCLDARINLVNDISAGSLDAKFLETVAESRLPYVLMHMQGNPRSMQENPEYEDVVLDIVKRLDRQIHLCQEIGIAELIVDPGFGFGKSVSDNYRLLANLSSLKIFDFPILVGLSRKSMIYKPLDSKPENALNGTTALHMIALQNGASILRVHDVKPAKECIKLWTLLKEETSAF